MRLPRLRLRIRSVMVGVAIVGLLIAFGIEARRLSHVAHYRQRKVQEYAQWANIFRQSYTKDVALYNSAKSDSSKKVWRNAAEADLQLATEYEELSRKWQKSAFQPWLTAPPNPLADSLQGRASDDIEKGNYAQALLDLEQWRSSSSKDPEVYNLHAWLLATCPDWRFRDGKRAVALAKHACELAGMLNSSYLDTLAAACAEAGDFAEAVRLEEESLGLLPPNDAERKDLQERLDLYKAGKPFRFEPGSE